MVRLALLAIIVVFVLQVRGIAAADLILKIPANDPAHAQMRLLNQRGLLSSPRASLTVDRYDIALALIEPMSLFIALADTTDPRNISTEQRRLREQAVKAVSNLSREEMAQLLSAANQLLLAYADVIEALSPELTGKAKSALERIRRMADGVGSLKDDTHLVFRISVDPKAEPDNIGKPLPLLPINQTDLIARPFTGASTVESEYGVRPANTMEAAMDIAFGRFQLLSKLSALPGQDPSLLVIRPDQLSGSAMFRLEYNIGKINDLSIAGIVEYHILRSYEEPGNTSTRIGAVGGVDIRW